MENYENILDFFFVSLVYVKSENVFILEESQWTKVRHGTLNVFISVIILLLKVLFNSCLFVKIKSINLYISPFIPYQMHKSLLAYVIMQNPLGTELLSF